MNTETADNCKKVIAFLTARANNDEEAGMALVKDPEEAGALLIGMTDFALAQCEVMAGIVGVDVQTLLQTLGMANTMLLDGMIGGK